MKEIAEKFQKFGVVPVVVLEDTKDAVPLAKALVEGGLPCAEVTFRTEAAEESIRLMAEQFPEMLVGAGTVLTTEQVDAAVGAGAKFIVSPGFDPKIVDYCLEKDIPVFPGCITPSEVAQAVKRGLKVVKFFPGIKFDYFLMESASFFASAVSSLILSNSPAFTRSPFTIQLPPQQRILSQER